MSTAPLTSPKTQPPATWVTPSIVIKSFAVIVAALATIVAFGVGTAGLLGIGINSMSTLKSLSVMAASFVSLLVVDYFASPTYEEIEEYLPYLKENEYIEHRGGDEGSPYALMVSVLPSAKPFQTLSTAQFQEDFPDRNQLTRVLLVDLRERAWRAQCDRARGPRQN